MTEYIQALQRLLMQLTTAEQQDVVAYYREYLQDAGITTYQEAVAALGTPQAVARKALADYSIKLNERAADMGTTETDRQGTKENVRLIWVIILALLTSPVTIPIVLVLGALIVAAGAVIFALVVTGITLLITGFVGGAVGLVVGLTMLFKTPAIGAFYLGLGLTAVGTSWLVTRGVIWLGRQLIMALAHFAKWAYNRWMPKGQRPTKRGN